MTEKPNDSVENYMPLFASETYNMINKKNKQKNVDKINDNIKHTGFHVDKDLSNKSMVYYKNDDKKQVVIGHRGTDLNHKEDIADDLHIALGQDSKHMQKRRNRTDKVVKATPQDYEIHMTGHSLGSHMAVDSAIKSKNVRDRVKSIHTFNGAFSPFTKKPGKKIKKDLDDKIIHHRIAGDAVSASNPISPVIGTVKTYKPKTTKKYKGIPKQISKAVQSLDQLNIHTINNFL